VGRTLDANRLLAGSACGKRHRGRPLNSVVSHHMSEAHRPSVPRKWLLAPAITFVVVVTALALATITVPDANNFHGLGGLLFLASGATIVIITVVELFALAISVTALLHAPELRTGANWAALVFGASPFVVLASWLIYERM
jgi:hypothetical protein